MNTRGIVVGVGARTPLGLDAIHTGFIMRTGQAAMTTAPLLDSNEEPITFCTQPTLPPLLVGWKRALELLQPAMEQALAPIREHAAQLRVRMLLSIDPYLANQVSAPDSWGRQMSHAGELVAAVQVRAKELAPSLGERGGIAVNGRGGGGPGFMLPEHLDALNSGHIDALLFAGVHTDYDPVVIAQLEEQGRLYSPNNLDSLIPGELGAAVLLMRGEIMRRANLEPYARLLSIGAGFEEANPDNDHSAFEAKGLTLAVRAATQEMVKEKLTAGWTITDLTFEMRRIYEWQSMLIRMNNVMSNPYAMDSPAQRMGHLGAAAMPLQMALASVAFRRGYAPSQFALAFAGSDSGERAAFVMSEG